MPDSDVGPRSAVLLGAGASFDAGLPLTHQFAGRLIDLLETDHAPRHPLVRAMYFVYGAMVGYHSRRGRDPREAVNVETLISALRLLQDRDEHEVAPFVISWNDLNDQLSAPDYAEHANSLESVIHEIVRDEYSRGHRLEELIRQIAHDVMTSPGDSGLYWELEHAISVGVRRILLSHGPVDYLKPLLDAATGQPGGMDVATLNYDLTVEHAGELADVAVDPGPADPGLGIAPAFAADAALRLYKLHGSIDLRKEHTEASDTSRMRTVRDTSSEEFAPRIVIGDRDKLGSGGATLSLLAAFARALENADRLVTVGYSFRDDHINNLIYGWLDGDTRRTLTVLDPSWPRTSGPWDPRQELTRKLLDAQPPRIAVVRARTRDGLARAMSLQPTAQPDPRFTVAAIWSGDAVAVTVHNRGAELTDVRISTYLTAEPREMTVADPDATQHSAGSWTMPRLGANESVDVHLTYQPGTSPRAITVSGDDDLSGTEERWDLTEPPTRRNRS